MSVGAPPRNQNRRFASLGVAVLVFLVYLPDVRNGFVYDDHEVILQQAPVQSLAQLLHVFAEPHGLPQSNLPYYRPTTRASLLLQKGIHGDEPALFHLVNALLMGAVAVAAHALLRSPALGLSAGAAAWAAAAFALHPIASECVHPIASGRESSMPAIFMLASLAAWLRGGARGRVASALLFAIALWSKEQAIVVPLGIALADLLRLAPQPPGRRVSAWLRRLAPFAIVLVVYLAVRGAVVSQAPEDGDGLARLAAHWRAHPFGPLESLLFLLQSTFVPRAALFYEPSFAAWFSPLRAAVALLAFAATLTIVFAVPPAERPAPSHAASLFWVGWLPIAMLLNANLLPLEALFAERYVFVSSLGVAALIATAARRGAARIGRPQLATGVGVAVLLALAAMSLHRGAYYRDELAFTRQWVATAPGHANAHASLGAALARDGRLEEALPPLREAVRLEPRLAAAHYNLGATLAELGRRDEAIAAFRETLRQWSGDADAHYALGVLLAQRGERNEARSELRDAIRLRPGWAEPLAVMRRLETATP